MKPVRDSPTLASAMTSAAEPRRRDERKLVTILFADLVGSTDLGEQMDPERLGRLLEAYFEAMTQVIERWGGTVEKYIGDAIMAVFGVPQTHEDDPYRAVGAALEMLDRLAGLNAGFASRFGVELHLRIGINTGQVLAPIGGRAEQMLVVGDAVNTAARLEQAAEPGAVLVGRRTHAATLHNVRYGGVRHLDVKGKAAPVDAWPALGRLRGGASGTAEGPIVGRQVERQRIAAAFDEAVRGGQPRSVLVIGPPGIGKSRLVREALADVEAARPGTGILRSRCLSAGNVVSYWALGELVRDAFRIDLDASEDEAVERLTSGVTRDLRAAEPLVSDADVRAMIQALAVSSAISVPDNPIEQWRPIAVAQELARRWPAYLAARAAAAPLVVVVEDLHWADEQLLTILESIQSHASCRILLVMTARPEFEDDHASFIDAVADQGVLPLAPLPAEDARAILDRLAGGALPGSVAGQLLERADGNPFFLEQLVGGLVDAGALARGDGTWTWHGSLDGPALPDTVHGVLAARIDQLPPDDKLLLQEAAVVGRTFWPGALVATAGVAPEAGLTTLGGKGFIAVREDSSLAGEAEYTFRHALIVDVAYDSVPMGRRARSHARVGDWLNERRAGSDERLVDLVAHHYRMALLGDGSDLAWADEPDERAALRNRAFEAIVAAGALGRRRNAIPQAVELHTAARSLAIHDQERAIAEEELGDDHGWGYHGDPSVEAWTRAIELRRALGDGEGIARICVKAARTMTLYYGGFRARPTGEQIDRILDEGLAQPAPPALRAWLLTLRGRAVEPWAADALPDPVPLRERVAAATAGEALAREAGDPTLRLVALRTLAGVRIQAGEDRLALELADHLAEAGEGAAARDQILVAQQVGGLILDVGGDAERALAIFRSTHERARDLTAHERMHATYFVMAAQYRLARWQDMEPYASEHMRTFDEETVDINCPFTRSGPVLAAMLFERLGQPDAVVAAVERIVPNWERPGLVEAWIAERALRRGETLEAREVAGRVRSFGRGPSLDEPPYELGVLIETLGELATEPADAALLLAEVRERSTRVAWLDPAADRAEGRRAVAAGHTTEARAALERALGGYRALRMPNEIARVEADLSALRATA